MPLDPIPETGSNQLNEQNVNGQPVYTSWRLFQLMQKIREKTKELNQLKDWKRRDRQWMMVSAFVGGALGTAMMESGNKLVGLILGIIVTFCLSLLKGNDNK